MITLRGLFDSLKAADFVADDGLPQAVNAHLIAALPLGSGATPTETGPRWWVWNIGADGNLDVVVGAGPPWSLAIRLWSDRQCVDVPLREPAG